MKTKWKIFIGFSVVAILFIVTFIFFDGVNVPQDSSKPTEYFKFIVAVITAWGVLSSSLLTSFNSIEANEITQNSIVYQKKSVSFDFVKRFDSPSLKDARDITRAMGEKQSSISDDELIKMIEGPYDPTNEKEQEEQRKKNKRSVITMFNFFEEMYNSITENYSNEDILKKHFAQVYQNIYNRYKKWLDDYLQKISPTQYTSLKELQKKWDS